MGFWVAVFIGSILFAIQESPLCRPTRSGTVDDGDDGNCSGASKRHRAFDLSLAWLLGIRRECLPPSASYRLNSHAGTRSMDLYEVRRHDFWGGGGGAVCQVCLCSKVERNSCVRSNSRVRYE